MQFTPNKNNIIFYEKPGCAGNARQKKILDDLNISYMTKSILDTKWEKSTLEKFFDGLDKKEFLNSFAPQIKNKLLDIDNLSKEQLIEKMIDEPILIKRPLLEIDQHKICGFDIKKINKLLDLSIKTDKNVSTCQKSDSCV